MPVCGWHVDMSVHPDWLDVKNYVTLVLTVCDGGHNKNENDAALAEFIIYQFTTEIREDNYHCVVLTMARICPVSTKADR